MQFLIFDQSKYLTHPSMMKAKILAIFIALFASTLASKQTLFLGLGDVGMHDDVCAGKTVGTVLSDNNSCDSYIECSSTGAVSVLCPEGQAFNEEKMLCDDAVNVKCTKVSTTSSCGDNEKNCKTSCCRPQKCACSTEQYKLTENCKCKPKKCLCKPKKMSRQACCKCCKKKRCSCRKVLVCCVVIGGSSSSSSGWGGSSSSSSGWGGSSSSSSGWGGSSSSSSGWGGSSSSSSKIKCCIKIGGSSSSSGWGGSSSSSSGWGGSSSSSSKCRICGGSSSSSGWGGSSSSSSKYGGSNDAAVAF